jgi:hypothetical protein
MVFDALAAALQNEEADAGQWQVFYNRPIPGSMRRIDFIVACPGRGLIAIEVKGGMVHDKRGAFRQLISSSGQRKRIDPFGQLKRGLIDLFAAARVAPDDVPVHQVIWFPEMGQKGLRWPASPHILTYEQLDAPNLSGLLLSVLPTDLTDKQSSAVRRVISVLSVE